MNDIGARMKALRDGVGLSQKELGAKFGVTGPSIVRYEHNRAEATYGMLLKYADYFDISLDYLLCRTDKPQGKLYDFQPKVEHSEDMKLFIDMCFDPNSPMSDKLKKTLLEMMTKEGDKKS
ncbi:MAG: helix-turn-helix domain-containing protein [Dehalococcoidia bacterium]|nr:helix-turn-helix domain-containing protein [Dehalococcoidia bacterium]